MTEQQRAKKNAWTRARYAEDPEQFKARTRRWRENHPDGYKDLSLERKLHITAYRRNRYATDTAFRERCKADALARYHKNKDKQ